MLEVNIQKAFCNSDFRTLVLDSYSQELILQKLYGSINKNTIKLFDLSFTLMY